MTRFRLEMVVDERAQHGAIVLVAPTRGESLSFLERFVEIAYGPFGTGSSSLAVRSGENGFLHLLATNAGEQAQVSISGVSDELADIVSRTLLDWGTIVILFGFDDDALGFQILDPESCRLERRSCVLNGRMVTQPTSPVAHTGWTDFFAHLREQFSLSE